MPGVGLELGGEFDGDNWAFRPAAATGFGAFAGILVEAKPISFGNLEGFNQSFGFEMGVGPAAHLSVDWGPNGFQINTGFGIGIGTKFNLVDFGYEQPLN